MPVAHPLFWVPCGVTLRACRASIWHAACRCDALDISSLLTDAAAAVVDDSFLRQAFCENSSSRQLQHDHRLCCSCAVTVLQARAFCILGLATGVYIMGGVRYVPAAAACIMCFAAAGP